jgi:uncharacterized protein YdaU (DUF1376 family)
MKPLTAQDRADMALVIDDSLTIGKPPAFPFYVNDWLGSGEVGAMLPEQEGGYIRLMAVLWASDRLAIPSDPKRLAMISRLGERWSELGPAIVECFSEHPSEPGKLTQRRLLRERAAQVKRRLQNQANAKQSHSDGKATAKPTPSIVLSPLSSSGSPASTDNSPTSKESPQASPDGRALAEFLHESLVKALPGIPESKLTGTELDRRLMTWAGQFDRFGRLDSVTAAEYHAVIAWALADDFWRQNIHSPGSLRTRKKDHDAKVWIDFRTRGGKRVNLGHYSAH